MANILDRVPVDLTCDKCGHKFVKTVAKLKAEPTLACPFCHLAIRAEYARAQLAAAEKSVADFARSVRGLSDKPK